MFLKNHPDVEQGNTKWLSETALSIPLNILSSLYSYAVETVKLKKKFPTISCSKIYERFTRPK